MFNLAHFTFAYLFGRITEKKSDWHLDRGMWFCLLAGGDLPDIDSTLATLFNLGPSFHGGITHTGLGALVIGLILGSLFWFIESIWRKAKSKKYGHDKTSWDVKRLGMLILISFIGAIIHLLVDILNTSNSHAREHHLYLWPFSDYSFHLDLMLAGMPNDRMDAWAFRPVVRIIMVITNILLISWLWFTHFKSDKHLWDLLYSESITYPELFEEEEESEKGKLQAFLDKKKVRLVLNYMILFIFTALFIERIIELMSDYLTY